MCWRPWRPEEGSGALRAGVSGSWELLHMDVGSRQLSLGPVEEQEALFTARSFLQPPRFICSVESGDL